MLVDTLPLVVVFRVLPAVVARNRLRGLIGLEPLVERLLALRVGDSSSAATGEHQVIVGLQILGIDFEDPPERRNRIVIAPLQEEDAPDFVEDRPVSRVLSLRDSQMFQSIVVPSEDLQGLAIKIVRLGELGIDFQRLLQGFLSPGIIADLNPAASHINESIGIGRIHLRDLLKHSLGASQIALQKQADATA